MCALLSGLYIGGDHEGGGGSSQRRKKIFKATKSLKNSTNKRFVNIEFNCCAVQLNELVNI